MNEKVRAKEIERGTDLERSQRARVRKNIKIVPTSTEKKFLIREREKPFYSPTLNTGAHNKAQVRPSRALAGRSLKGGTGGRHTSLTKRFAVGKPQTNKQKERPPVPHQPKSWGPLGPGKCDTDSTPKVSTLQCMITNHSEDRLNYS